ncbi:MAG TPA: hypothetical protein VGI93_00660 [Steroidobacteraceae bacterium]
MAKKNPTPEQQLGEFIDKFEAPMASFIRAARRRMRALLPRASELVYDNYNFFVIAYAPSERASQAILSLAAHARGLTLFFLHGKELADPHRLLLGGGKQVRSVKLESMATLRRPEVLALIRQACSKARIPLSDSPPRQLLIKSVSAKQRPRRVPFARSKGASKATRRS